jgi:uncharacterized protein YdhG (YjbR/CyaY superfamily)
MHYKAISPEDYISQIPKERQEAMKKLRKVIKDNLPKGFEEGMNYNMIGYYVPHTIYPNGYHCDTKLPLPFMNIASQKNFMALYHMGMYAKKEILDWFTSEYPKHCKYKLDMGKSCVRFKKIEDIPYDLIGQLTAKMSVDEWIQVYENAFKK